MVRPVRNKKPVNYSQFEDSNSDDDFVSATGPLNKKSRTTPKELKLEKPKPKLKNLQKEDTLLQEKTPKKRIALDDKLYQRDLEVALALSVKELPTVTIDLEESQGNEKRGNSETEMMDKPPHISNCSVASDYLDLDKITEEDDSRGAQGKRKAASKALVQQRRILLEGSDGDSAHGSEPDFETGEDSEDDSDFSEGEDNDEDFTVKKSKEIKKKEVKVKSPVAKKVKKPKSKCNALVTSVDSAPAAVISKPQSSPKKVSRSSEASRKPLQICSPSAEIKRPKWVPPAVTGSSSTSRSPLAAVAVKSPNQSLRLGLSRLARVKPLHPNVTSS
ncbi:RAD51-associated protein 1 isoform X2 [Pteronotus mesoamericanus]|uniref:RAD51-associated protein 1 isoform X2 n=1 Tax=Pteronotus mesoamericanus TaxID=1884717 RepID=UPI0023EB96B1|nr:RAD51-associated protein 1 isoform X2 [Pteronotus parnellii mesoamericanus]